VLAALVAVPLVVILLHLTAVPGDLMRHLASTVLPRYLANTAALVSLVGVIAAVLGVTTAWLTTMYEFPGRRLLSWALVLPLSIPPYIAAYTMVGTFSYTGAAQRLFRVTLGMEAGTYPVVNLASLPGAALILALVLYPYVYLVCRASFHLQTRSLLEVARGLPGSALRRFLRVALPLARPAVAGGVALVVMETLNDYGAVHYLGVDTFTTGIFRTWFSFGEPRAALFLSGILLLLVFALLALERRARGRARYNSSRALPRPLTRTPLAPGAGWLATLACLLPVSLGFLLPFVQLVAWVLMTGARALQTNVLALTATSFLLAATAAVLVVAAGLLVAYAARLRRGAMAVTLGRLSSIGYAVPGAVVALGVMTALAWTDQRLADLGLLGAAPRLLLSGTVIALLYAYGVRFFAVGHSPVEAGMERVCDRLHEVSRTLGQGPLRTLLRVEIPLLRRTLMTAGLLVFTDVIKELPLTLILRPFGVETLATRAYQLAGNEQVPESALPSLLIIAVGMAAAALLVRTGGRRG
jgi:iron(III) transport system permease protein